MLIVKKWLSNCRVFETGDWNVILILPLLVIFLFSFMLHVPLHITRVIDVGGVSLCASYVFSGTQNDHKPIMVYFGHGSGRLLN